jgi:hypothetical protein
MKTTPRRLALAALLGLVPALSGASPAADRPASPIIIGSRLEPFVDDFLIESLTGAEHRLHAPLPGGTALRFDRPWEGSDSNFVTVFRDGSKVRMYYRAGPSGTYRGMLQPGEQAVPDHPAAIAYAESTDGIRWTRPSLQLYEFQGSKDNNIVWVPPAGIWSPGDSLAMFVFRDENPAAPESERYKALAGTSPPLLALASPDGLRWRELRGRKSLITEGLHKNAFDNPAPVWWNAERRRYEIFFRDADTAINNENPSMAAGPETPEASAANYGNRSFKVATSPDFATWSFPRWVDFGDAPREEIYTSTVMPYYRAPHVYVGWPMRLFDSWRKAVPASWPGISDMVFMTSRDQGAHWNRRFMEAFVRPGRERRNWTDRSQLPAWGLVETAPDEVSLYVVRNYHTPSCYLERLVLRADGFVSAHAGYAGGELRTKPLVFRGDNLYLNFAASAAGHLKVEIQDLAGKPLPGFSLDECPPILGDEVELPVRWTRFIPDEKDSPQYAKFFRRAAEHPLARLQGKPVRLRIVLKDADLYALRFK